MIMIFMIYIYDYICIYMYNHVHIITSWWLTYPSEKYESQFITLWMSAANLPW